MGIFGGSGGSSSQPMSGNAGDLLNGFADLNVGDMNGASQPPPASQQLNGTSSQKKTNEDLLSLF